jgi:hypothetical protein
LIYRLCTAKTRLADAANLDLQLAKPAAEAFELRLNAAGILEEERDNGLDHPDPRRNLHRPRDQRLSAGRNLIF